MSGAATRGAPAGQPAMFNAAPTNGQPINSPTNAPNPYMSGSLFQSAPMASAPIQNVMQPTSAPQPALTLQQKIAQFQQKGSK